MKPLNLFYLLFLISNINCLAQGFWAGVPNSPQAFRFDDICFSNDTTVFIAQSSKVYRSTDKGNTWSHFSSLVPSGLYVRSLEFIDSNIGFAGLISSAAPLNNNLYRTMDGGLNWTLLQNMQSQPDDGICGMAHYGNTLVGVGTYSGPAWFYRTDDFGTSWTKVDLSSLAAGLVDCYMMSSDTILVSGMADSTNQLAATILKSNDGGQTWTRVYLSNEPYTTVWKMYFRPTGLGLASIENINQFQSIARTVDFGNNWNTVFLDTSIQWAGLGGIGLLNDSLGWVTDQGNYGTFETQDGGLTWAAITSPVQSGDRLVAADSVTMLAAAFKVYRYQYSPMGIGNATPQFQNRPSLTVFPNPTDDKINIIAHAVNNTFGVLDVLDNQGKLVRRIARRHFVNGDNTFIVDIRGLPQGNYKVAWHCNEGLASGQFTIIH